MSRVFDISSASDGVRLDGNGQGQVVFTATNSSGRPLRGRFKVKPLDAVGADAITIDGAAERNFNPNDTQQVAVKVKVPPGTKAGKYRFRLDGVSIDNPDEDFTEGPALAFDVAQAAPPPKRWWIYAVAALLLVAIGAGAYIYLTKPIELPNVVTRTYDDASSQLTALGLKVKPDEDKVTRGKAGLVSGQQPAAGQKVKKGTEVTLMVTGGLIELPDVTHRSYEKASSQLLALGLMTRPRIEITARAQQGDVIDQDPPARQILKAGTEVILTVAAGAVTVPQVTGRAYRDVDVELRALGLIATPMPKPSDKTAGEVIEQDPAAGQTVEKGSQVKLAVAAAQPPSAPPPSPFIGSWVNQNRTSPAVSRVQIEDAGNGTVRIRAFDNGPPVIDWGWQPGGQIGPQLMVAYSKGAVSNKLTMALHGDLMTIRSEAQILGQARQRDETFVRARSPFATGILVQELPRYLQRVAPAMRKQNE